MCKNPVVPTIDVIMGNKEFNLVAEERARFADIVKDKIAALYPTAIVNVSWFIFNTADGTIGCSLVNFSNKMLSEIKNEALALLAEKKF